MPRRKRAIRHEIIPDPKFNSVLVSKFINNIMRKGKKCVAEKIFYTALDIVEKKTGQNGLEIFQKAVENVKPVLEVKARRIGGATYQVPV
ncbi:MAG TPA: 30S ribosomal protein S7, partial [Candidatus Latescibacteria bacterium]|nr:30S ribosomal protein S7 [Candidatus Latescibacterota bacterium]